jgi:hypothetical protein
VRYASFVGLAWPRQLDAVEVSSAALNYPGLVTGPPNRRDDIDFKPTIVFAGAWLRCDFGRMRIRIARPGASLQPAILPPAR